jgi:hypothetical protein
MAALLQGFTFLEPMERAKLLLNIYGEPIVR